jgi:Flp pilus assembly CpaE family ATPase
MPSEKILPVVNHFVRKTPISPEDVAKHLGSNVYATIPNDYQVVQPALDFGRPLVGDTPDAPVRKSIAEMANRIYKGQLNTESANSKRKDGVLSRWFGS